MSSTAVPVPPFEFVQQGDFTDNYTYTVPASGEVQPYTSTATFANASGQAIQPTISIYSAEGNLLARVFPAGSIADGDTAEVTWMPPFGSAASSSVTPSVGTTKSAQYAAPPSGAYTIVAGDSKIIPVSNWTLGTDPDGIFDPTTNKVTADGQYTFVLEVQQNSFAHGTNPVVGGLLWPQTGFPIQGTAPTQAATLAGAVVLTWVGFQMASDVVLVDLYNRDSVSATFVAFLLILKNP